MQIVIDIPSEMYSNIKSGEDGYSNYVHTAVRNGTPISDNAANGDIIKALFPQCPTLPLFHDIGFYSDETRQNMVVAFPKDWWNALYKTEREGEE